MDYTEMFRLVNLGIGVVMVLGGISQFFGDSGSLQSIIVGCYVILFGIGTAILEFQIPPVIQKYANFMFSFVGRGVFYIFAGSILLHGSVLRYIAGTIIGVVGLAYCALEFIPSIEPPQNMRDASWDAGEQV